MRGRHRRQDNGWKGHPKACRNESQDREEPEEKAGHLYSV